jgi:hypothetical protein
METEPKRERRLFQFRLRTLLIGGVALVVVAFGLLIALLCWMGIGV